MLCAIGCSSVRSKPGAHTASPAADAREQRGIPVRIEGVRCALAVGPAQPGEFGIGEMEPVHRHMRGGRAQPDDERLGQRGLARARCSGDAEQHRTRRTQTQSVDAGDQVLEHASRVAGVKPTDLAHLITLGSPTLSPDGRTAVVAVVRPDLDEDEYRTQLWTVATDGSAVPRRLTHGTNDSAPRYSPDGRWLAFLRAEPEGKPQLHVLPADGGDARKLTDLPLGAGAPNWSPDSTRIAFSARVPEPGRYGQDEKITPDKEPPRRITGLQYRLDGVGFTLDRRQHVYVVDVADSDPAPEPKQLTDGDWDDTDPTWSPDGASIAFLSATPRAARARPRGRRLRGACRRRRTDPADRHVARSSALRSSRRTGRRSCARAAKSMTTCSLRAMVACSRSTSQRPAARAGSPTPRRCTSSAIASCRAGITPWCCSRTAVRSTCSTSRTTAASPPSSAPGSARS